MPRYPDSRKERHWLDLIRRWGRSSLTVGAFCERHGLSQPRFYFWRRVLRERGLIDADGAPVGATTPAFVKLAVDPAAQPVAPGNAAPIELVLPRGLLLRVRPGFDPDVLRQLLELAEELSC